MSIENEMKEAMEAVIKHLDHELKGLRTGRANPALLDGLHVEVYGTQMRLRDIANITVPESRQLLVTPFDPSNSAAIGKAIERDLGMHPVVDANAVRVNIPPMDEAMRKDMVKQCKKRAEEAKVGIRDVRRKANEQVRKQKADGDIPEDMQKRLEKKIQEATDTFCGQVDELCSKKEKEISII